MTIKVHDVTSAGLDLSDFNSDLARSELIDVDLSSIRGIREFLVDKFGTDPAMSSILKEHDSRAAVLRAALK